jgi:hypothetical protein
LLQLTTSEDLVATQQHRSLLFLGACDKQESHIDDGSDARQLNGQG